MMWLLLACLFPSLALAQQGPVCLRTSHDRVPHFAQFPTNTTIANGAWSDLGIWSEHRLPAETDVVLVKHDLLYDREAGVAAVVGIDAGAFLKFSTVATTTLSVGVLLVLPGGTLEIGTAAQPVRPEVTATITIRDAPLGTTNDGAGIYDPEQWGAGLLVIDGTISLHGTARQPTFARLTAEVPPGATSLLLAAPVLGWQPGDRLILPDSRHVLPPVLHTHWEELTLSQAQGTALTLATPTAWVHPGARDAAGAPMDLRPHVANLTRNVVIRSEDPTGTRGHVAFLGASRVDIRYVGFRDLGRTTFHPLDSTTFNASGVVTHVGANQVGRYMLHIHRLRPPTAGVPTFTLVGNAVDGGSAPHTRKWGIAVHDSKSGLIAQNVVYNVAGAGVAFEEGDGKEDHNVLEHNIVVRVNGWGCSRADSCMPGREGDGYWFRGTNNYIRGNVAANVGLHGYTFFGGGPFLQFQDNEYYGGRNGLTMWHINGAGTTKPKYDAPQSVVKNFTAWNVWEYGIGLGYPSINVTFDGLRAVGDPVHMGQAGWYFGDYQTRGFVIKNADIQGFRVGIHIPLRNDGLLTIEDAILANHTNIYVGSIGAPGGIGSPMVPRETILRRVLFGRLPLATPIKDGSVIRPQRNITMALMPHNSNSSPLLADRVSIEDYNGTAGDSFRVFSPAQHPDFIVPQTGSRPSLIGVPVAGLTNTQAWEQYGLAMAGEIAPCVDTTTHPEIVGFTCRATGCACPPIRGQP